VGVISHAGALAQRVINDRNFKSYKEKRAGGGLASIGVDARSWDAAAKVLEKFPNEMKYEIVRKAGRAAAIVVRETANTMLHIDSAPRLPDQGQYPGNSKDTRTFEKKSQEQQSAREGRPSMTDKVGIKPQATQNGYLHMIGPRHPWGSHAWILEWGGVIQLWGSDRYYHLVPRPFMDPAGNNTKREQSRQFIKKMQIEWDTW